MKLRSKIQLIFGGTLIVSLVTVGLVSFNSNVGIAKKGTQANMQNAVTLSVGQISSDLDNYLKMAVAAGKDAVITDPKIDKEKKVEVMNRYYQTESALRAHLAGATLTEDEIYFPTPIDEVRTADGLYE